MATTVMVSSEVLDSADWNCIGQCLAKYPRQWKWVGIGMRTGGYFTNVCAVRVADGLGGVILTSGLCVAAAVTAALSTQDTVKELFQAQMPCFLTIWCAMKCMVCQTGMV